MEDHVTALKRNRCTKSNTLSVRSGFTLIELLVSIAIIAILISIMLPAMAKVHEKAKRVICGSNMRQIGIGLHAYANDYESRLPASIFLGKATDGSDDLSSEMNLARVSYNKVASSDVPQREGTPDSIWDGLGLLYLGEYLGPPEVFYCPSHHGENPYVKYSAAWNEGDTNIVSNFQYRGRGPRGTQRLDMIVSSAALVSDSLSSINDYNHKIGTNVLRADGSVIWIADDSENALAAKLLKEPDPDGVSVSGLWNTLDSGTNN